MHPVSSDPIVKRPSPCGFLRCPPVAVWAPRRLARCTVWDCAGGMYNADLREESQKAWLKLVLMAMPSADCLSVNRKRNDACAGLPQRKCQQINHASDGRRKTRRHVEAVCRGLICLIVMPTARTQCHLFITQGVQNFVQSLPYDVRPRPGLRFRTCRHQPAYLHLDRCGENARRNAEYNSLLFHKADVRFASAIE